MRCVRTESATASSACATRIPHVAKRCVINLGVFKLSELVFDKRVRSLVTFDVQAVHYGEISFPVC